MYIGRFLSLLVLRYLGLYILELTRGLLSRKCIIHFDGKLNKSQDLANAYKKATNYINYYIE